MRASRVIALVLVVALALVVRGFAGGDDQAGQVRVERVVDGDTVVLSGVGKVRLIELAAEAVELYCWDRLGSDN